MKNFLQNKRYQKRGLMLAFAAAASFCVPSSTPLNETPAARHNLPLPVTVDKEGQKIQPEIPSAVRPLTRDEKDYFTSLFGSDIDLKKIRVLRYETLPDYMNLPGFWENNRELIAVSDEQWSENYIKDADVEKFGFFIRWAGILDYNASRVDDVAAITDIPALAAVEMPSRQSFVDTTMTSLKPAEQINMISLYAQRFLHVSHNGIGSCQMDDMMIDYVESNLPQAKSLRNSMPERPWEFFTPEEASLAFNIFGPALDTSRMRKNFTSLECIEHDAEVTQADEMTFRGARLYSPNYAMESNRELFGLFLHEITHNFQIQNGITEYVDRGNDYDYTLSPDQGFYDYTAEQQAEIIRDYALSFLHVQRHNYITAHDADLLRETVETAFPQASISRKFIENHGIMPSLNEAKKLSENTSANFKPAVVNISFSL